jgi:hypothetical protein
MAVDLNTGNTLGFSAVPCDTRSSDDPGCMDDQNTIAAGALTALGPEMGLGRLHSRIDFGLFGTRGVGLH